MEPTTYSHPIADFWEISSCHVAAAKQHITLRIYLVFLVCQIVSTHCNTLQHTAIHCNTLQYTATHCNTLQYTATHCNTLRIYLAFLVCQIVSTHCNTLQYTATHFNTLQHTATHCSTLQHTATHCGFTLHFSYVRSSATLYNRKLTFEKFLAAEQLQQDDTSLCGSAWNFSNVVSIAILCSTFDR